MANYMMVSADFPDVSSNERDKIYECLKKKKWKKIKDDKRDVSTIWEASFKDSVSEDAAKKETVNDFIKCSKPYTKPKFVMHFGQNEPTIYDPY